MHPAVCACWALLREWKVFNVQANILEEKVSFPHIFPHKAFLKDLLQRNLIISKLPSSSQEQLWPWLRVGDQGIDLWKQHSQAARKFGGTASSRIFPVQCPGRGGRKKGEKKRVSLHQLSPHKALLCFLPREVPREWRVYFLTGYLLHLVLVMNFHLPFRWANSLHVVKGKNNNQIRSYYQLKEK